MQEHSHQEMVNDLEKHAQNLSDWEIGFVDSISKRLADGKSLSEKQAEKLRKIWEEKL